MFSHIILSMIKEKRIKTSEVIMIIEARFNINCSIIVGKKIIRKTKEIDSINISGAIFLNESQTHILSDILILEKGLRGIKA